MYACMSVSAQMLTPEQREKLEEYVRGKFSEWLVSCGSMRQVTDLVHLEPEAGGGGGGES